MNKSSVVFLMIFLFASCKEISFREPQPKGRRALTSVPVKLQGKYLPFQETGDPSKDTIIITPTGYRFGYFGEVPPSKHTESYESGFLSDTLVMKSFRGYYFLSIYKEPEWLLRVIKQERNGDLIYMTMEQEDANFSDYLRKLSYEIAVDSIMLDDETLYHIDPNPSKLVELIDKGFFNQTILKKIR